MAEVIPLENVAPSGPVDPCATKLFARNGKTYMTGIGHGVLIGVRGNCATISDLDCITIKHQVLRCKHPNKIIGLKI